MRRWLRHRPPIGLVRFGSLRRVTPISRRWGYDRGLPIDRYYIEAFVEEHRRDIRGTVLEVREPGYTHQFGSDVKHSEVIVVDPDNTVATIVADLADASQVPDASFDCVIVTQTLQFIYDVRAAVDTIHRILKPRGVVLATFPGIARSRARRKPTTGGSRSSRRRACSPIGSAIGPSRFAPMGTSSRRRRSCSEWHPGSFGRASSPRTTRGTDWSSPPARSGRPNRRRWSVGRRSAGRERDRLLHGLLRRSRSTRDEGQPVQQPGHDQERSVADDE
jgi:SAM-dependent methyltransferase